jgi:hypothetical protein
MDTAALLNLVEKSYLLSEPQRAYWRQQLPRMDDTQKSKLEAILRGTDLIPFQKELEKYLTSLGQAAAKLYGMNPNASKAA